MNYDFSSPKNKNTKQKTKRNYVTRDEWKLGPKYLLAADFFPSVSSFSDDDLPEDNESIKAEMISSNIVRDEEGLIVPKKLINPCLESSDRQNLHRELLFNQKM